MKRDIDGFPYQSYIRPLVNENELMVRSEQFYQEMDSRRTVREFSDRPVSLDVVKNLLKTAGTAPSGAHKQPWTFCVVSNPDLKKKIREAAEAEERKNYEERMNAAWIQDLKPLGTNWEKPFLEMAPHLIAIFKKTYGKEGDHKVQHYYVNESVGLATGFLLAAIHQAGLVALTHTPSPMNFLSKILERPENEKPYLLIPIGYPLPETFVPALQRKPLEEIAVFY
ncbi:nitroreductase family protein [Pararhodonellum marinum]|uniref:nitroreductase family protein n=1 Tax=Pararhodonellum marinum TaxID=2755358 RepID=UPI00188FF7F1|nr:nitroreductase family protein [Pararhodonellum marinum]